jgi:hypothetical protein
MIAVPDSHRDRLDTEFARPATVDPDGRPQLSEVWFLAEEDALRVSLKAARQKLLNLRRNPAVSRVHKVAGPCAPRPLALWSDRHSGESLATGVWSKQLAR